MKEVASESLKELHNYIEQGPHRLNLICFIGGVAIILNGVFFLLDVTNIEELMPYIVNGYQVFFGGVTCLSEIHPEFAFSFHDSLENLQAWMHTYAKGLTMLWGRGLFYVFQGSLVAAKSGLVSFGFVVGIYMVLAGLLCLFVHFRKHGRGQMTVSSDYYRIAPAPDLG
eukprot:TRINITY_DN4051_c0_g1_i1.p1 TRINITY_DN4051_c0_g1~~TRINITY_DN4051_c0_g1_i1.p1  ORF type:complete len:193 (+),score=22.71 TRINITY_DN4051_c0_g1_i1:73-579(+)